MGFIDSFIRIFWNSEGKLSSYQKAQLTSLKMTPEDIDEFERLRERISPFDFEVGKICSETFLDVSDKALYYGILGVIQRALKFGLEHANEVEEMLEVKSKQNEQSEDLVFSASIVAENSAQSPQLKPYEHVRKLEVFLA
ncbi:MAG: hypothetical protein IPI64_14160 [Chloracidobacterium sp.]|nr:hypothetical protein [Chloracidobacterium sp.]